MLALDNRSIKSGYISLCAHARFSAQCNARVHTDTPTSTPPPPPPQNTVAVALSIDMCDWTRAHACTFNRSISQTSHYSEKGLNIPRPPNVHRCPSIPMRNKNVHITTVKIHSVPTVLPPSGLIEIKRIRLPALIHNIPGIVLRPVPPVRPCPQCTRHDAPGPSNEYGTSARRRQDRRSMHKPNIMGAGERVAYACCRLTTQRARAHTRFPS